MLTDETREQVGSLAPITPTVNGSTNADVVPYKGRIVNPKP